MENQQDREQLFKLLEHVGSLSGTMLQLITQLEMANQRIDKVCTRIEKLQQDMVGVKSKVIMLVSGITIAITAFLHIVAKFLPASVL